MKFSTWTPSASDNATSSGNFIRWEPGLSAGAPGRYCFALSVVQSRALAPTPVGATGLSCCLATQEEASSLQMAARGSFVSRVLPPASEGAPLPWAPFPRAAYVCTFLARPFGGERTVYAGEQRWDQGYDSMSLKMPV